MMNKSIYIYIVENFYNMSNDMFNQHVKYRSCTSRSLIRLNNIILTRRKRQKNEILNEK